MIDLRISSYPQVVQFLKRKGFEFNTITFPMKDCMNIRRYKQQFSLCLTYSIEGIQYVYVNLKWKSQNGPIMVDRVIPVALRRGITLKEICLRALFNMLVNEW